MNTCAIQYILCIVFYTGFKYYNGNNTLTYYYIGN